MSGNPSNDRKSKPEPFIRMPRYVQESKSYNRTSSNARELLNEILYQYKGDNNGNLLITWEAYKHVLSYNSRTTFTKALEELKEHRLIEITGTGTTSRTRGKPPYLYAITWLEINVIPITGGEKSTGHSRAPPRRRADWERDHSRDQFRKLIFGSR